MVPNPQKHSFEKSTVLLLLVLFGGACVWRRTRGLEGREGQARLHEPTLNPALRAQLWLGKLEGGPGSSGLEPRPCTRTASTPRHRSVRPSEVPWNHRSTAP